jgi:hypothetical protein
MTHPSLFPYCLSHVCSTWNNICLGIPQFWTRIFVDIGFNACSIFQLQRELKASQDSEIDIYISRRDGFTANDPLEYCRIDTFIKILSAHTGRCRSIHVETMNQSSLVPLTRHFLGSMPALKRFYAHCKKSEPILPQDQNGIGYLRAPGIKKIEINALLFKHYLLHHWITSGLPRAFKHLTILDISNQNTDRSIYIPLVDTFHALDNVTTLRKLSFVGVNLDPEEIEYVLGHEWDFGFLSYPRLDTLLLKGLQPRVAAAILRLAGASARSVVTLGINNCSILDVGSYYVPSADNVLLEDMSAAEDLRQLLWGSMPRLLSVTNCPSFTSQTLDQPFSPRLAELVISNDDASNQLSITSIKKFVAAQLKDFEIHLEDEIDFEPVEYAKIRKLELKGFKIIDESDPDYEWLQSNVDHFIVSNS